MLRAQGHKMRVQNYNIFTYLPNIQAIFFYFCNCAVTLVDDIDYQNDSHGLLAMAETLAFLKQRY